MPVDMVASLNLKMNLRFVSVNGKNHFRFSNLWNQTVYPKEHAMKESKNINKNVGERIRYYRKARGMTIVELADYMHISKSAISKYENGQVSITLEQIEEIAAALKINSFLLLDSDRLPSDADIIHLTDDIEDNTFVKYYMYGYSNHGKAYLSRHMLFLGEQNCRLYCEIESEEDYHNCKYYYIGKLINDAAFQRVFFINPLNRNDLIVFEKSNPLGKKDLQFAFGASFSLGTNYPLAFKWLLSHKKLSNPQKIKELLTLSPEDIRRIRIDNAFSVDFKDARLD